MSFENSSTALQLTATIQKEGHCSVNRQWGTPKTPAPSGPLTLYVGPSRDAGRLRARQDRHRAAAPALSNGADFPNRLTQPSWPGGSGRVALSRPPVDRSAGERPTILGSLQNVVSLSPVGGDVPSSGGHVDRLLGQPRRPHSPVPPTLLTLAADLPPLSRSSSLSLDPLGATLPEFQRRRAQPSPPGRNALPRTPDLLFWGPSHALFNQSRCSVEKSASPLYTAT